MGNIALIRGDKGQVKLEILGYENAQATNIFDLSWLRAKIAVVAGPFSGAINVALTTTELDFLYQQLATAVRNLSSEVEFSILEGQFQINVKFARTGVALVQGSIAPNELERNVLRYEFRTDPITLEATVQDLKLLVTQFPIRHSTDR